ncbi:hypothetical protein [Streptomyces sporangiiformans]|uniref:STAS domain-containing protein n=1 Tax=Streptomyces sporangiiformans TaxID=2315329 RepID=A0A505DLT8_9ACTN|nr:hypothetical protein [Streptomyces sporangiiformans]TPQ21456.1 hypothetical protein FGD71_014610 [Streptomyces sporangiiformans]
MEIPTIRMRLLAEAPSRLWMAAGGTLGATTQRQLRQWLHGHAQDGYRQFFLDLRELRCADGALADELHTLFPRIPDARFHLIGAPDRIRDFAIGDERFILHTAPETAWWQWAHGS